jgi:hypothetical protein
VSTYRASVHVDDDDMLHTSRPLNAPEKVAEVIDSVLYDVQNAAGSLRRVEVTVETAFDSGTPIGDGISGTSSEPLPSGRRADDVDEGPATPFDDEDDVATMTEAPTVLAPGMPSGQA